MPNKIISPPAIPLEVMEPLDSYTVSGINCQAMGIPLEGFGLCNGQFECGPTTAFPLCQDWTAENTNVTRVAGGIAGNWCIRGGQAGLGDGGYILSNEHQPVYENLDYQVDATFWGSDAKSEVALGAYCYDQDKTYIGTVWSITGWLPGIPRMTRIGPNGDVAWIQGTRYARIVVDLQTDASLTGNYAYVDDVQFGQMKTTYSPQIRLTHGQSYDSQQDFTAQAWTLWNNSQINLTLEEPGYIHYCYTMWGRNRTHGARTDSWSGNVFIGGVQQTQVQTVCSPGVDHNMPATLCGISDNIIPIGAVTVDLRIWVHNAGDNIRMRECNGWAWYTRAY